MLMYFIETRVVFQSIAGQPQVVYLRRASSGNARMEAKSLRDILFLILKGQHKTKVNVTNFVLEKNAEQLWFPVLSLIHQK